MGIKSTPFITFHEINVTDTDLLEDAWGLNSEFCDVIGFLGRIKPEPDSHLIGSLIELVKEPN
jgi:hypothetical protein